MHVTAGTGQQIHPEYGDMGPVTGQLIDKRVQSSTGSSYISQQPAPPTQKPPPLDQRNISVWTQLPIQHDSTSNRFYAPVEILTSSKTVLSFSDLTHACEQIKPEMRVEPRDRSLAGTGAFAKQAFKQGEIVGFYTGTINYRKPMPLTLLTKYLRLANKKTQDIALPLHAIWYLSESGEIVFRTDKDTYTAWSQGKFEGKNTEVGIDGQHPGSPFQYLNHSFQPNTVLITTVAPRHAAI